ncbi:multicopper oxidase family protein [Ferrovibrio terrae]|uniref:Multicopper oxidase family protein n=1 Tax=Ferrovibrio terrae TaxID=2594003 RepID=A0A516GZA9_9PROT|nr:multicopper oxidase family protein [Ferrovibrio terrae]QDO96864.1 multicopper oxidase family protein [Ferrovibrio terrae]
MITRRHFLTAASSVAAVAFVALPKVASAATTNVTLMPAPATWPVMPNQQDTAVWAYNNSLPGPVLRLKQNDRLRAVLKNNLTQDTTIHWHGIRLPNAMDGVPGLTQKPVRPGASFTYDFACQDAGTFWYHPHAGNPEQVGRGLYGLLIVDEPNPPPVDRDVAWVLSDLRLNKDAQITPDFGNFMDLTHAGRLGNVALNNGKLVQPFAVTAGERIRLRLVNTANARIFDLRFSDHAPWIVALDGHPLETPLQLGPRDRVTLGPGMRADLIVDLTGNPATRYSVFDRDFQGREHRLTDLAYGDAPARASGSQDAPTLAANPVGAFDAAKAERLPLVLGGGMGVPYDLKVDGGAKLDMRQAWDRHRMAWSLNGEAMTEHSDHLGHNTLFSLKRGRSYLIEASNETSWPHPVHLHGHVFRVLTQPGKPWRDTVLLQPNEKAQLALVADNPGHWMLHCHILEHQAAGMMATVSVK